MKLNNALLPHQIKAVEKLAKLKVGALYMEQGTGKTITALELCRQRLDADKVDKIIWLCPCSAKQDIKREIQKQAPIEMLSSFLMCGIETLSSSDKTIRYLERYVETYRCFLVVDESLLVKNHAAIRTQRVIDLAVQCPYRLLLNGTPISKNECDLYSQFRILDWRILGYQSFWAFAQNHVEYDKDIPDRIVNILNVDYIMRRIAPYTVEIKKKDCLQLPSKRYKTYGFSLTEEQSLHYDMIAEKLFFDLDELHPETVYRLFAALQAILSGKKVVIESPRHFRTEEFFNDPKENPRMQALSDCLTGEKTIIFCHYSSEIRALEKILPLSTCFYGEIPMKRRMKNLDRFETYKRYLLANRNCAGYGLNLQYCHNIIYLSNNWNLATRLQSEDRVHRIGQESDITITDIYADNTLDVQIMKCLNRKENLLEMVKEQLQNEDIKQTKEWVENMIYLGKHRELPLYDCSDLIHKG